MRCTCTGGRMDVQRGHDMGFGCAALSVRCSCAPFAHEVMLCICFLMAAFAEEATALVLGAKSHVAWDSVHSVELQPSGLWSPAETVTRIACLLEVLLRYSGWMLSSALLPARWHPLHHGGMWCRSRAHCMRQKVALRSGWYVKWIFDVIQEDFQ